MSYAQKLHALGQVLDRRFMRDVCVAEVPGGFVVSGVGRVRVGDADVMRPLTFEVQAKKLNADEPSGKRRWPW